MTIRRTAAQHPRHFNRPQKIFCLEIFLFSVELSPFFETAEVIPPISQSNVWEPGENPGRLRHCNGYNSQCHWSGW